jgi:predicted  nucleic acid-binding Zn-ribbon protein
VLPLIIAIGAAFVALIRDNDKHDLQIHYLQENDIRHDRELATIRTELVNARAELIQRLDKIAETQGEIKQQIAVLKNGTPASLR